MQSRLTQAHLRRHCAAYEAAIRAAGGIDLQLLGMGRTGHIGFNEAGSSQESITRLITLDQVTRTDAASDFFGEAHVPRKAITMGIRTIMQACTLLLPVQHVSQCCMAQVYMQGSLRMLVCLDMLCGALETCLAASVHALRLGQTHAVRSPLNLLHRLASTEGCRLVIM